MCFFKLPYLHFSDVAHSLYSQIGDKTVRSSRKLSSLHLQLPLSLTSVSLPAEPLANSIRRITPVFRTRKRLHFRRALTSCSSYARTDSNKQKKTWTETKQKSGPGCFYLANSNNCTASVTQTEVPVSLLFAAAISPQCCSMV